MTADSKQREEVFSETFNIDELEDTPQSSEDFAKKYSEYLTNTASLCTLQDASIIEENSDFEVDSDDLFQSAAFSLDCLSDNSDCIIFNALLKFHRIEDMEEGWGLLQDEFWSSEMSDDVEDDDFQERKSNEKHKLGDYSEYSEYTVDGKTMVVFHIKWRKLIICFSQLMEGEIIDSYIEKVESNFGQIQKAYGKIDQDKVDQLVDKAINDFKDEMN